MAQLKTAHPNPHNCHCQTNIISFTHVLFTYFPFSIPLLACVWRRIRVFDLLVENIGLDVLMENIGLNLL